MAGPRKSPSFSALWRFEQDSGLASKHGASGPQCSAASALLDSGQWEDVSNSGDLLRILGTLWGAFLYQSRTMTETLTGIKNIQIVATAMIKPNFKAQRRTVS
jgi:hypothetical protein